MTDILRSEFEKLPEIAEKLHTVVFNKQFNTYFAAMINSGESVKFVQGAWYAYQAQQQRITEALTWLTRTDIRSINNAREILQGGDA